jgi:AcrR family transcriptional regulator
MAARRTARSARPAPALEVDDETSDDFWGAEFPPVARSLLTSAVVCFARNGFHATTTRHITSAVELSPGALYVHFSSKEDVLYAIMRVGHQRSLEALTDPRAAGTDAPPQDVDHAGVVADLVRRLVAWHARHHTVARVCQYELSGLSPEHYQDILDVRKRITDVMRATVGKGVAAGTFDVDNVHRAVRAILSLGVDLVRWYRLDQTDTPEELGNFYAGLALRMLGARRGFEGRADA